MTAPLEKSHESLIRTACKIRRLRPCSGDAASWTLPAVPCRVISSTRHVTPIDAGATHTAVTVRPLWVRVSVRW